MRARVSGKEIFTHDGIRDTLTHLAAPPYFYESLKRQISKSNRSVEPFSIIRFVIECRGITHEEAIVIFAEAVKRSFRLEDLIARTGVLEFAVIFEGELPLAHTVSQRFISKWCTEGNEGVTVSYAIAQRNADEIALDLLNRLDTQTLLAPMF